MENKSEEKFEFDELSAHIFAKGINPYYDSVHILMKPKKTDPSSPVCLIPVIDISGSMDSKCYNKDNSVEKYYITRIELVKHSLRTIISTLRSIDMISIITFNNDSKIVIPPTVLSTKEIKDSVINKLNSIEAVGLTNLWSGIDKAILTAEEINSKTYQKSIMIFTDGESNSDPPLGIIPTLEKTLYKCKRDFLISTFSFGDNVNSKLLTDIAKLGNGIYGYCPDSSMVGTIFLIIWQIYFQLLLE